MILRRLSTGTGIASNQDQPTDVLALSSGSRSFSLIAISGFISSRGLPQVSLRTSERPGRLSVDV